MRVVIDIGDFDGFNDVCVICEELKLVRAWGGRALCDECFSDVYQGPKLDEGTDDAWNALPTLSFEDLRALPDPYGSSTVWCRRA